MVPKKALDDVNHMKELPRVVVPWVSDVLRSCVRVLVGSSICQVAIFGGQNSHVKHPFNKNAHELYPPEL